MATRGYAASERERQSIMSAAVLGMSALPPKTAYSLRCIHWNNPHPPRIAAWGHTPRCAIALRPTVARRSGQPAGLARLSLQQPFRKQLEPKLICPPSGCRPLVLRRRLSGKRLRGRFGAVSLIRTDRSRTPDGFPKRQGPRSAPVGKGKCSRLAGGTEGYWAS